MSFVEPNRGTETQAHSERAQLTDPTRVVHTKHGAMRTDTHQRPHGEAIAKMGIETAVESKRGSGSCQ